MNKSEYLLQKLSEECAEVAQRASKCNTFGVHEIQPGQELDNAQRLSDEYADLCAVFGMLIDEGIILPDENFAIKFSNKKEKVAKFMEYSREKGCLQ